MSYSFAKSVQQCIELLGLTLKHLSCNAEKLFVLTYDLCYRLAAAPVASVS